MNSSFDRHFIPHSAGVGCRGPGDIHCIQIQPSLYCASVRELRQSLTSYAIEMLVFLPLAAITA